MKMKRIFMAGLALLATLAVQAQFDASKKYTIVNRNDANIFMQDNGTGVVALGSENASSYWQFEATANTNCYYVKNVATGNYMQSCSSNEVEVQTGTTPVEYYIELKTEEGEGMYGMASTDQTTYNFTAGTIGANWKNNGTVQGYAAVAGTNHRSFWKIVEYVEPEPVETQASPYQGTTVQAGTEFYLYNVESGLWLEDNSRNSADWTSHAELGYRGFDVELAANGSGWRINPKLGNNHSINGDNLYMDTGAGATTWNFEPVTVDGVTNAYHITTTVGGEKRWLHAVADNTNYLTCNNVSNVKSTWQIVTREQRLAYLETATEENPVNASWLIKGASFPIADERINTWTRTSTSDWAVGGDFPENKNRVFEKWNISNFSMTQTFSDVPNGKYKLEVRGCYSPTAGAGLNENDLNAYNAGTLANYGWLFANDQQVNLPSIYSWQGTSVLEHYHSKNLNGTYVVDGVNQVSYSIHHDASAFVCDPVEVTVIDGILKVGAKVEGASGSAWMLLDNFKLTYLGPVQVDVSEYLTALNNAIADAEAFNGNTTDILQSNFDTALSEAIAARTSTDPDELIAKTSALKQALDAAKAIDDTNMEQTIPLAQAEGINVSAAQDFVVNGTDPAAYSSILEALRNERRFLHMETLDAQFAGNVPEVGKSYYFYNVGTKMFFQHGSWWGTHSAVGMPGLLVTLERSGSDDAFVFHNLTLTSGGKYTNPDGFVDTGDQHVWKFKPVAGKEGVYNIVHQSDENRGMAFSPNTWLDDSGATRFNTVDCWWGDLNAEVAQWILVSKEDRDALLETASANNPVDASYYIKGASATKWETDLWNGIGRWGDQYPDFAMENWNAGNKSNGYQVLTGLTPGKYRVTVQGYYRDGSFENQVANAATPVSYARLYAYTGDYKENYSAAADATAVLLPNILAEVNKAPGLGRNSEVGEMPDSPGQATEWFELGLYAGNSLDIEVGEDGKLVIGVMKERENAPGGDWVVVDNFRLICLGTDLMLDETKSDNFDKITQTGGAVKTVRLARPLVKETWNTIYLPFQMTGEEIAATFGEGTQVAQLSNYDAEQNNYSFQSATEIAAGIAYLIKPTADAPATYVLKDKISAPLAYGDEYFVGSYDPQDVAVGDKLVAAGNKILAVTTAGQIRAYFPASTGSGAKDATFTIDGQSTGIIGIDGEIIETTGNIYDLQGRKVNKPQHGVYIMGGKKVVVK